MGCRPNPFPRKLSAILMCLTVTLLVPLGWIYEICVVLPAIHAPGGYPHVLMCLFSVFMLLNIEGNFLASMMIDTSVDFENVVPPPEGTMERLEWKYCKICDKLAPPRSRHCKYCQVCILKQNHHCGFTGYCVGHRNERYFMCFVLYTVVGSSLSMIYNGIYMWILNPSVYGRSLTILRLWSYLFTLSSVSAVVQFIIFGLNFILLGFSVGVLYINLPCLWHLKVGYLKESQTEFITELMNNLKSVFGLRMHVAWLFPAIKSPLPEDGYSWKSVPQWDAKKAAEN